MDFRVPDRIASLLPDLRAFVADRIIPLEAQMLAEGFAAVEPKLLAMRDEAKRMGLFAPHVSRDHGGAGLTLLEFAFVAEELGRSLGGHYVFNCQAPDAGNMEILAGFGTEAQRERYLQPLVAGEVRSCFAMTEPERPGSNPTWLATTARREGEDFVIDGHKWFTTGAEGSAFTIVMAVTEPEAESPHLRASQIVVPMDNPGVRLVRNIPVMGEAGSGWASHGEVVFENCRVPQENLLGEAGAGFLIAQERLGPGRIHHCMRWIGICERAFDMLCRYAASREIAPGKPLGTRQMVQEWIAELRAEIDAARLMVLRAAWKMEEEGSLAAREEIAAIKFYAAGVLQKTLDRAIQAHGGLGLTDDTPLAFWFRHERAARVYDGADEVHKSSLARRILRRYGVRSQ